MIALFPARMNPPHLGHILTLFKIKDNYEKIIVAITSYEFEGEKENIMPVKEVLSKVHSILKYFPEFEVIHNTIPFRNRITFDDLPKFDIVVTGSKGVYNNAIKHKFKAKFIQRTVGYRGETMRKMWRQENE